jgi:hypothetical protein
MEKDSPTIAATLTEQAARIAQLEAENLCAVCAGTGKPVSGLPCICGGTGKACDEAQHLRERVFDLGARIEKLQAVLRDFIDMIDKFGEWNDDCFFYRGVAANELEFVYQDARDALREK